MPPKKAMKNQRGPKEEDMDTVEASIPTLALDNSVGNLVNTITNFDPQLVSGVTLDSSHMAYEQQRVMAKTMGSNYVRWDVTLKNNTHMSDIIIQVPCHVVARGAQNVTLAAKVASDPTASGVNGATLQNSAFNMNAAGVCSIFHNLRIRIGNTEILGNFEQSKQGIANTCRAVKGAYWQRSILTGGPRYFNGALYPGVPHNSTNSNMQQILPGNEFLLWCAARGLHQHKFTHVADESRYAHARSLFEIFAIPLYLLIPQFQQNAFLPAGLQIIIECEFPTSCTGFSWSKTGLLSNTTNTNYTYTIIAQGTVPVVTNSTVALTDGRLYEDNRPIPYTDLPPKSIAISVVTEHPELCVYIHNVIFQPQIERALFASRATRLSIYNYIHRNLLNLGTWQGFTRYQFMIPQNQAIPQVMKFGWVNPICRHSLLAANRDIKFTGNNNTPYMSVEAHAAANTAHKFDQALSVIHFSGVPARILPTQMIISRGGYSEIYYNTQYYESTNPRGAILTDRSIAQITAAKLAMVSSLGRLRVFNNRTLTKTPAEAFFTDWRRYEMQKTTMTDYINTDSDTKSITSEPLLSSCVWYSDYIEIKLNPAYMDLGMYSSDQNNYLITLQLLYDANDPLLNSSSGLTNNFTQFHVIREYPAQFTLDGKNNIRLFSWPNLLVESGNIQTTQNNPTGGGF
jgi:hypothetical protein